MQLSEHAWPLDPRLSGVNFARAWASEDPATFVLRRLVIELCRYLHGEAVGKDDTPAPTTVFVSHTKLDIAEQPSIFDSLKNYLTRDNPVAAWIDSADIAVGSEFAKAIEAGVKDTSLLCVLTDHYASREWCRKEILLAKEHQRPIVVIDGLKSQEIRSFPYLGNVPVVRWRDDPVAPIDILLKETLRVLHAPMLLERWREEGDAVFVRPPELATLVERPSGSRVLYPDPPLGVEEARILAKTGITSTTPLERLAKDRSLAGKRIAISVSESTDIQRFGLTQMHMDEATLELCRYLLIRGATLVYGGHLGAEGYTDKLTELVRTHNVREGVEPFERIVNYRGWPLPRLEDEERAKQMNTARINELPRPADINEELDADLTPEPAFFPADRSAAHRYAWARGMTQMREKQTAETDVRIVVGGTFGPTVKVGEDGSRKESWYMSRIPGLLEEVVLSARAGKPVFLIGAFGGVAALVADLVNAEDDVRVEATWAYQNQAPNAPGMRELYAQRGQEWLDYPDIVKLLRDKGLSGLNPLLSEEKSEELCRSRDVVRIVELVLEGLA
jgi:hypothetical protein